MSASEGVRHRRQPAAHLLGLNEMGIVGTTDALNYLRTQVMTPAQEISCVRFGSEADMCDAQAHVRFTPNSDRNSGRALTVMSALPPKADMCGATGNVGYGPIADIVAYIFRLS
jgi:hypothetical protein